MGESVDRTGKLEPDSAADSVLAKLELNIVDAVVFPAVREALRAAYQLGLQHGRMAQ